MTAVHELSLEQRMKALHRANEIRIRRAQLKRDVTAGRVEAHEMISDPPEWIETMRGAHLLLVVPGFGPVKTRQTLERCGLGPQATIGGLSQRQRTALVAILLLRGRRNRATGTRPERACVTGTMPQHMVALNDANKIRLQRGDLHAEVGALPFAEQRERLALLLEDPPSPILSMPVVDLLMWADRVGSLQAGRMMRAARVSPGRTIRWATERQRQALARCLRGETALVREEAELRETALRAAA